MKMKKLLSIVVALAVFLSLFITTLNADAQTVSNPNEAAAQIGSVQAIRNSLKLVWNDEFGGDIGCGAQRQALVTTNGTDLDGNFTSNEVRATAKWAHERYRDNTPKTRNGQLQHYVIEDGRNSWTEDGVLHIRGQREENGHVDPITGQTYYWTADGLRSSYFDTSTGQANLQAFRFGMMEARIYTVNGKALEDSNGNPVLDKDGNIQQDPKYSQGLWNGFWTTGNPDMSKECSYIRNKSEKSTWPYCGEIDIDESYTAPSSYSTYNSATAKTDCDSNGIIISYSSKAKIKYDANGKILVTDKNGTPIVTYNTSTSSYEVAQGNESAYTVSGEQITIAANSHVIKQDTNGKTYISDKNNKTVVDTEGNCYGTSTLATGQLHYRTGERFDGSLVSGVQVTNEKTTGLGGGFSVNSTATGNSMLGDTGYHTYGVYWTPTQLVYYYDDLIVGYHDITDPQYFQLRECPQYLFLTFPIGGSVPGNPNPALDWAEYLVDYVRVYQADDGYNTNPSYQGSYGFPQLNDLDQPISYYNQASQAYSNIKIVNFYNSCEFSSGAEQFISWSSPFRTSGKVCNVKGSSATIKTKEKIDEGKYDVYVTGVSRSGSKDYSFTLNGVGVGTELALSDYAKDKYDREYGSAKSCYIGTVDITNGAHNLEIGVNQTKSGSKNGMLLSAVLVKNDESVATVTVNQDTPLENEVTSSSTTTTTTTKSYEGTNYEVKVSKKEKYVSNREITNDSNKDDITMILVIGQSNATTGVGYPCEVKAVNNGHRDEITEVTATPEAGTVYMAKYGQTITELNNSNDVKTLIENENIGGFSAAMGKKWNELTGEKVVIVQAAKGARGMHEWVKDNMKYACACGHNDALYSEAVSQYKTCYNALKQNYNIKHSFYIWNQGEHDDNYYSKDNVDINSKEKYFEAYKSMHEDLLADLPLDFGSINIARAHYATNTKFLSVSRLGQYKAINTLKGCYLASRFFETTTDDDMDKTSEGSYGIHATQKTYNTWGVDSAQNLYNMVSGNSETLESVELITNSSKKGVTKAIFNADGELTSGSDVLTADEVIMPAVQPFGDFKVTYAVNGDKTKVDAFGTADASVFAGSDDVKINLVKYDSVLQDEEEETTSQVAKPTFHLMFNPNSYDFTYVENNINGYYNKQSSYEYYRADAIPVGGTVTFTTISDIPAGKYSVNLEARTNPSGRAIFDVSVGDKTTQLDTNATFVAAKSFSLFSEVTVSQTGKFDITFNATSSGTVFLYRLNLICTELFDSNTEPTEPSSTEPTEPTEPSSTEPTEPTTEPIDLNIDMTTVSGASIRLNAKTGLRFYTVVDKDKVSSLRSNGYTVQLGTLIAPYDLVNGKELTFDLEKNTFADVKYLADEYYTESSGFSGIVGSIVNIQESTTSNPTSGNIARYFVARGYAKITDDKSNTTVVYADYSMNKPRSLGYVAYMLKNDTSEVAQALYQAFSTDVDRWAYTYLLKKDPFEEDNW